jgi:uncharacterized protein (TIGR02302 family)
MMTRYSDPNEFRTGSRADETNRFVAVSRAALLWERAWPALWPASAIAGVFLVLALFDLFAPLPWILHALILGGTVTAIGLSLYFGFRAFRVPSWFDGARRLEQTSAIAHRPISEHGDTISAGRGDPLAEELWKLHLTQQLARIGKLRLGWPSPNLAQRDPRGLRFILGLLLLAAILVAGADFGRRLWAAFNDTGVGAMARVDAWIDPPAYTGQAPVYLTPGLSLAVPAGSTLNLRVHGAGHAPALALDSQTDATTGFTGGNGEYAATYTIGSDAGVRVRSNGRAIGDWRITSIPDKPPVIAFIDKPGQTEHAVLKLRFHAGDDYGVVSVHAVITPLKGHGKPLNVDIPLPDQARVINQTSYADLTANPYAGLDVNIALVAKDAIGQTAATAPQRMRLPARVFTNPLARALIEQRQSLAVANTPGDLNRVVRWLDALTYKPDLFFQGGSGPYTGIRAARWSIAHAERPSDVEHAQDLLWQIATGLERGGMLSAAAELRALQAMIAQALAQGAPQEVIDQLLQRYQEAMHRYMEALAANPEQGGGPPPGPDTKVLSQQDLEALLKAIQQLAQSGSREQAQQLMALLQNLLENLRLSNGSGSGGPETPQQKAMRDAIGRLGDLMGQQRGLLDKTFKGRQGNPVNPKDLQKQQGDIQNQLNGILKGLGDQKIPAPDDLGRAGRSMGQSGQELGGNDLNGSSVDQKNALDALRSAANTLAKKMMEGQQQGSGEDPMGRKTGGQPDFGDSVKMPGASEMERARDILKELRRRAAERGRPQQELDYIDRLLKQF